MNEVQIKNKSQELDTDTTFVFAILSIIDTNVTNGNLTEVRASFGQKVKFYN